MKTERCDMAWRRTHGRAAHSVSISFAPCAEGAQWPDPSPAYLLGTLAGLFHACRDPSLPSWRGRRNFYFKHTSQKAEDRAFSGARRKGGHACGEDSWQLSGIFREILAWVVRPRV